MQLTGTEIIERNILTGVDLEHAVQQQGVDVRVLEINSVVGIGFLPAEGNTVLPNYVPVEKLRYADGKYYWYLNPGYYEIVLVEGCKIPDNVAMTFIQRSSLLRLGGVIRSSQFDAGFETEHMGTFMQVFHPLSIECNARIAQAICMESSTVSEKNKYNGQYQGDKQRN